MNKLAYEIVRSSKRTKVTITVERDRAVIVHVPEATPDDEIKRIVGNKRQWILEKIHHPQKYRNRKHPPGKEVVNGESAPYLGRDYRIQVIETQSGAVEFEEGFLVPPSYLGRRRKVLRDWYIGRANEVIASRALTHARELGVECKGVQIVDTPYRWGSCTTSGKVRFNWRLIKAPIFAIDYVIVHELAHLLEANHSARFWSIVNARSSTAAKAKAWLKEHGQLLEEEV